MLGTWRTIFLPLSAELCPFPSPKPRRALGRLAEEACAKPWAARERWGLSGLLTRHEGFSGQVQGWSVQAAALARPIVCFKDLALRVCPRKPGPLKGPQQLNAERRVCQRGMRAGVRRGRDAWPMPPGEGEERAAAVWPHGRHAAACLAAASPGCLVLAEISSSVIPAFSCRDFLN